jgi:methylase of polypeptide subunit release factors
LSKRLGVGHRHRPRATEVARANVSTHRLEDRVFVRFDDLLEPVPAPVNLIVANLPYPAAASAGEHDELVTGSFAAVFATGDGLGPHCRLVDAAATWLACDGTLLLQLDRRITIARPLARASGARHPLSAGADDAIRAVVASFAA